MRSRSLGRCACVFRALVALGLCAALLGGQNPTGRAIGPASYDEWRSIQGAVLSNDGAWAVYTLTPFVGEGELVVRSTRGPTEHRVPRGYISRPNYSAGSFGGFRAPSPALTADSRWVVFSIEPNPSSVEQARRAKKKPADQPKSTLGIMDLRTGAVTRIDRVKSYRVPSKGASIVAYVREPDSTATPATPPPPADTAKKDDKKDEGFRLVVRDLATGTEVQIADVASHVLSEDGLSVAYAVSTKDGAGDGVFVRALPQATGQFASGAVTTLATGAGRYRSLAFDRAATQVGFMTDKDEYGTAKDRARFAVYHARLGPGSSASPLVTSSQVGGDLRVAANGTVEFTRDGAGLLFGVGPQPVEMLPADSLVERAVFDLWHYQDDFLQPTQKLNVETMRQPWYEAVYWLDDKRWLKLGNDSVPDILFSFDGKVGLAGSTFPYRIRGMWGDMRSDVFVVDARTGQWTLVKKAMEPSSGPVPMPTRGSQSEASISPAGKYVLYWERRHWHAYNVATGKTVNLTENLPVAFWNELDDHPALPGSYGQAGWTTADARVLLNDRFDVWEIDPSGTTPPKNLTDGVGRATKTIFRVADVERANREEPWLDPFKPLYLTATDWETKATGIYRDHLTAAAATGRRSARTADGPPVQLIFGDKQYRVLGKAKDAEQFLVTQETFREFPDLWTGTTLAGLARISNANPQQAQYRWGTAQLVSYTSTKGAPLKAILYKPDGFDPTKKYPMMVHTYERVTQGMHGYIMPRPSAASVNVSRFVSNGYVVLMPDIVYEDGHPGQSFVSAIVPATQALIDSGYIDPKHIGFEGFSWGGYQGAYLATQSDMFAAIAPGAPVANMSSAYGGIRWSAGINRSMQYERTQSRIGATPWEKPELYLENSALFHIDQVRTPLLFMHNDADGAVPWYQGIELYIALRRLQREAYLFNYNDDGHGVSKTANMLDWDMRLWDFFEHHLRGAPKPAWMAKGIPYIQKGRDQAPATIKAVIQP
jgi:dipeptidyl aminopeptidase/acylaminoacyl peptidase